MKVILKSGFLALAIMLASAVPANAGPYEDGLAAYNRRDYATAVNFWRPLAVQGHARAQSNLGFMYQNGQGVPLDNAEAEKWYRLAAAQGNAVAQTRLGVLQADAEGVPKDKTRVLQPGAEFETLPVRPDDFSSALEDLIELDSQPLFPGMNAENYYATEKWRPLAEQGDAEAQYILGHVYANGLGVRQDFAEAAKWYRMAADQGHAASQNNLGDIYFNGQGVALDYLEAANWYLKWYINVRAWQDMIALTVLGGPIVIVFLARRRIAVWWWSRRKGFRTWIFASVSWAMGTVLYFWVFDPEYFRYE